MMSSCRKTKSKVLTTAHQNQENMLPGANEEKLKICKLLGAIKRASDWLKGWHEFSGPMTERSEAIQWDPRLLCFELLKIRHVKSSLPSAVLDCFLPLE